MSKSNFLKIAIPVFALSVFFTTTIFSNNNGGIKQKGKENYCVIIDSIIHMAENEKYVDSDLLVNSFIKLSEASGIKNNLDMKMLLDYGTPYSSLSLEKSIFKIDLLSYMVYFNCERLDELKGKTQGNFSAVDSTRIVYSYRLEQLKKENEVFYFLNDSVLIYGNESRDTILAHRGLLPIDTSILYR